MFRHTWQALYRRRRALPSGVSAGSNLSVTAQQGLLHVTGQNAAVNSSRVVTAQQGLIHTTGQNATVNRSRIVTATQGVVHLTGQNASVNASRIVTSQQGLVHVTGQNATVVKGNSLSFTAQQGVLHVTGQNASINASRVITAKQGVIYVAGQNTTVTAGVPVTDIGDDAGGGSSTKPKPPRRRRKTTRKPLPPHYVDPERVKVYAKFGTDLLPKPPEAPAEERASRTATEGTATPLEVSKAVRRGIVESLVREPPRPTKDEQRAVLAVLEADEAAHLQRRTEEELLMYLMVA